MNKTKTAPLPAGAMARIKRVTASSIDGNVYQTGQQFVVNEYIPASEAADGRAFYWGSINEGVNNITVLAADCELALTVEQVNARGLPKRRDILDALMASMSSIDSDGFQINAADRDADKGTINYSGRTTDGLAFGFTIKLASVSELDA